MTDIHEIYDPIVKTSFNPLFIIITIIALFLIGAIIVFLRKRRKNKIKSPLEIYTDSLEEILGLKNNIHKIETKSFLKKSHRLLLSTINSLTGNNYSSDTIDEFINNNSNKYSDKTELSNILKDLVEKPLYSDQEITNDDKIRVLDLYAKIINNTYALENISE